jgi:hypothetical protein
MSVSISKCRACGAPKWRGDPCPNADCPKLSEDRPVRLRGSFASCIRATGPHGFHAPATRTMTPTSDYDTPIRSRGWRTVGSERS